ncbi:predicted protein [Uncinocarpus reesii 1704]|uniref:Uncharacterized protein n=1 Tax=Uncinocarpus reesii (strain UAMH 1704) TaxID=336963 RepID=C4JR39_UNCRE|nr:uncharacterized protein UREG_03521 [Uncinocarpus reesii 1704]EEP78675.1 predicted protein [Uncinocarpus reesii 1704]
MSEDTKRLTAALTDQTTIQQLSSSGYAVQQDREARRKRKEEAEKKKEDEKTKQQAGEASKDAKSS